nr:MAG TPA: hypothetical protein [Caudoviricetes sp.]
MLSQYIFYTIIYYLFFFYNNKIPQCPSIPFLAFL